MTDLELIKKLKNSKKASMYDIIANDYYLLSKEQLKELILNLNYTAYKMLDAKSFKEYEAEAIREYADRAMIEGVK